MAMRNPSSNGLWEQRRERRGERAALRVRGDQALVELELDALVSADRQLAPQRRGEPVGIAPVGRVAAHRDSRQRAREAPLPAERALALGAPLRVVEDPDPEVAPRA